MIENGKLAECCTRCWWGLLKMETRGNEGGRAYIPFDRRIYRLPNSVYWDEERHFWQGVSNFALLTTWNKHTNTSIFMKVLRESQEVVYCVRMEAGIYWWCNRVRHRSGLRATGFGCLRCDEIVVCASVACRQPIRGTYGETTAISSSWQFGGRGGLTGKATGMKRYWVCWVWVECVLSACVVCGRLFHPEFRVLTTGWYEFWFRYCMQFHRVITIDVRARTG